MTQAAAKELNRILESLAAWKRCHGASADEQLDGGADRVRVAQASLESLYDTINESNEQDRDQLRAEINGNTQ